MSRPVTDKQFRALIENSGDGLALIAADGSILYASPPGARILGRDAITSIGRPALDLVHAQDYKAEDVPEDNESLGEDWRASREGEIYLYLNKPVLGIWCLETLISKYLISNEGTAVVTIEGR